MSAVPQPLFPKVLVANRGEIARRVLRCLRALGIPSAVVYHEADRRSPAVAEADEAVEVSGASPTAAYLDIGQIVSACARLGVAAVHPGYGFLAENAAFARALADAGITFIGPNAEVMELMGDKIAARQFVAEHGFPVPPSVELMATDAGFAQAAADLGFPLVVKASAGGGGKGMNIVRQADQLESALRVAASEAERYFGDGRIYVERYFTDIRHIEVQVLGDGQRAVHLGERECSVQRRFQKVVEEAPSPALDDAMRARLGEAAVGIASAAAYQGAGTVEFLHTPEGEFFFLEMNTRIQVEHPVTELVYGVDLVAEQVRIAAGRPLSLRQDELRPNGHAIECRLCAEDPANDFLPETGRILHLKEAEGEGVRVDSGLHPGQEITAAFDPLLAKVVAHGPTRQAAIDRTLGALRDTVVLGVGTNAAYLAAILAHPAFARGATDTGFLDRHQAELLAAPPVDAVAKALAAAHFADRQTRLIDAAMPSLHAAMGAWTN